MSTATRVFDRLKQPEYTGENRCVPCTGVNLVVAAGLALAVWFLLPADLGPMLGAAVLVASVAAIYLRGYLVPGTPWFTKTYFPDRLLRAFDKDTAAASPPATVDGEFDVEAALADAGATEECADADDVCLTPEFREAWRTEIEAVRGTDARPRELVSTLGGGLSLETRGEAMVALDDEREVGLWESEAAFVADVAAARVLAERYPAWAGFALEERGGVLNGLRLFVERCPACDGPVTMDDEVVESCCRFSEVVAVTCEDCGARLFEAEVDGTA